MAGTNEKLVNAVETYFADLARVRASGGGTGAALESWAQFATPRPA